MKKKQEKILVEQILRGDKKIKRLFYKTFKPRLLKFIKTKVPHEAIEEVLDDTFLSAFDSLPLFKFRSSLYSWLYSIARHEIVDFYRRKKIKTILFSRFPVLENLASQALSPERVLEEKEIKGEVIKTLKNLSEGYSRILRLKYIDGLSYQEIAERLEKTVKAVESKLARARQAFAIAWKNRNYPKESLAASGS